MDTLPTPKPLTKPEDEAVTYCRAIWTEFCGMVGREPGYCCSSAEWALIYEMWQERLPIRIALRGVQDALEGRKDSSPPKSLVYYRRPIQEAYRMWSKALA